MYIYMYEYIHSHTQTHARKQIHTHAHTHTQIHIHIHIHKPTYPRTNIHTHTPTHIHRSVSVVCGLVFNFCTFPLPPSLPLIFYLEWTQFMYTYMEYNMHIYILEHLDQNQETTLWRLIQGDLFFFFVCSCSQTDKHERGRFRDEKRDWVGETRHTKSTNNKTETDETYTCQRIETYTRTCTKVGTQTNRQKVRHTLSLSHSLPHIHTLHARTYSLSNHLSPPHTHTHTHKFLCARE